MTHILKRMIIAMVVISQVLRPLPVGAQGKPLEVAIVQLVSHPALNEIVSGIYEEFEAIGYTEGNNLTIDFYNAEGDMSLLPAIAETVMSQNPQLVFAITTPVAQSLAEVSEDIPIILAGITDPVGAKLVESLEQPNTNITGVTDAVPYDRQFQLIQAIAPQIQTIGMLYTTSEDNALLEMHQAKEVAESLGYEVLLQGLDSTNDMPIVAEVLASKVEAIFVGSDNTIASAIETLLDKTDQANIPLFATVDTFVKQGALSAVAVNQKQVGIEAVKYAQAIIEGASPQQMPIRPLSTLTAVYNRETAERLGITIPETLIPTLMDVSEDKP